MVGKGLTRVLVFVLIALGFLIECCGAGQVSPALKAAGPDSWQYPIRLGDTRARVHELLGAASRTTTNLEEYPTSGVDVWFNTEGRVTKLNFAGEASVVYPKFRNYCNHEFVSTPNLPSISLCFFVDSVISLP
jgi:hypothetical protein